MRARDETVGGAATVVRGTHPAQCANVMAGTIRIKSGDGHAELALDPFIRIDEAKL